MCVTDTQNQSPGEIGYQPVSAWIVNPKSQNTKLLVVGIFEPYCVLSDYFSFLTWNNRAFNESNITCIKTLLGLIASLGSEFVDWFLPSDSEYLLSKFISLLSDCRWISATHSDQTKAYRTNSNYFKHQAFLGNTRIYFSSL